MAAFGQTAPMQRPLLEESDSEDDLERGGLPTYNQTQQDAGLKFLSGGNAQPRSGKECVALSSVHIRMGKRSFAFALSCF